MFYVNKQTVYMFPCTSAVDMHAQSSVRHHFVMCASVPAWAYALVSHMCAHDLIGQLIPQA